MVKRESGLVVLFAFMAFVVSIALGAESPDVNSANLIESSNPGFELVQESGLAGWTVGYGNTAIDKEVKHSGNSSLKITVGAYVKCNTLIPVEPGYRYHMSAWGKIANFKFKDGKYGCGFGLRELRDDETINGNWYSMQSYLKYAEGDKDWEFSENAWIPKETTKYLLPVIHTEALAGSVVWYDDIRVWKEPIKKLTSERFIDITENGSFEVCYEGGKRPFGYNIILPKDFTGSMYDRLSAESSTAYERGMSLAIKGECVVESSVSAINAKTAKASIACRLDNVAGDGAFARIEFLDSTRKCIASKELFDGMNGSSDWKLFTADINSIDKNVCYAKWVIGLKPGSSGTAYFDDLKILTPTLLKGLPQLPKNTEKAEVTVNCSKPLGTFKSPLNAVDHHCADRVHSWSIGTAGPHLEGAGRWYQSRYGLGFRYIRVHSGFNGNYLCQNIPYDPRYSYNWQDGQRGVTFEAFRTNYPEGDAIFAPVCRIDEKTGKMITDFSSIKHYLDHSILKGGMKPIFGLEPVPAVLALENNSHYKPKDMKLWEEFNYRFIKFLVDTYGKDEVLTWIFETGNEPSTEPCFHGRPDRTGDTVLEDFLEMQDYTVAGCTRALPEIFIAGPSGPPESFFVPMLEHCATGKNYATGQVGTKIDAISYHGYLGGTAKDISWRQSEDQILRMQTYTDRYYALTGKRLKLFNTEWTPIYHETSGTYDFTMHPAEDNIQAVASMHVANFSHKLGVDMLAFFYYAPFYSAPVRGDYPDMTMNQGNCPEFFGKETVISFHGIFKPVSRSFEMLSWLNGMTEISAESKSEPVYALAAMDSNTIKVLVYSFDIDPQLKYMTDIVITIDANGSGKKFKVGKYELSATKANSAYLCQTRKITQQDCEKNLNLIDEINNASKLEREDVGQREAIDGKLSLECRIAPFTAVLFVLDREQ